MDKREHFEWISLLRAIAMLLVVWAHLGSWWLSQNQVMSDLQVYYHKFFVEPFYLYQEAGHLGVLIFFLVSGWVITHVSFYETRKEFLIRRFFRIIPTLCLTFLLVVITNKINMELNLPTLLGHEGDRWIDYIYSLFLINYYIDAPAVLTVTWTLKEYFMF